MKKSPLLSIFLIVVVDVLGLTIILPLLPFYAEMLGASPLVVGLLISSYAFCQLIAGPILGQISDRVGRKPVLLVSQCGTFIGFIILAFSRTLPLVFLSRIIDGLTAGNLSVAQAYISDVTEPKDRTKAFALIGIAFGVGFLFGPAVSGFLAQFGYHYPIFAAAGLSATSIAATYFLLPSAKEAGSYAHHHGETPAERQTSRLSWRSRFESFQNPELAPLLWQFLAFIFAFAVFFSGFALFAERRFTYQGAPFGVKEVGYVFAYVGFLGVIIQGGLIGRLAHFFGERRLVQFGFLTMALGFAMLASAHSIAFLMMTVTVAMAGSSVLRPALTSLITQKVGKHQQGMAMGLTQSLMSVSQIIAPVISGALIQHRFLELWACVGAIASGLGLWAGRLRKS